MADLYWQLRHYYPFEDWPHLFRWAPTAVVNAAHQQMQRAQRQNYHALERPIAQMVAMYYNSKVESHKHRRQSDFEMYGEPRAELPVSGAAAATFFQLGGQGRIPGWAMIQQVLPDLRAAADKGKPPEFRALLGPRAILLCPVIHKDMISCDYAIVAKGEPMQVIAVVNPDTEDEYLIQIEHTERSVLTGDDARFKLMPKPEYDPGKTLPAMPITTS